ncbi:hypothetical protein ACP70R_024015 [Stipagrostis hirtigluma subsp. patula]
MAERCVQVVSPPCALVGAASFTSPRTAAWQARSATDGVPEEDEEAACCEDVVIAAGMMGVQLAGAAYMVVLAPALDVGLDPLFVVTFGSLANAFFTLPFSVKLERPLWPSSFSARLILHFLLLALGGVTAFQALMLQGMSKTSPAIAAAMPNLTPGFVFVVAASLGFERVDARCCYTRAKILGTAVCLGGAITMSVLQSLEDPKPQQQAPEEWAAGCLCLLAAVLVVSCSTVLQAATMVRFPAPITLCTVTSLLGALLTGALQVLTRGELAVGTRLLGPRVILALVLGGGGVSSACVAFQTWAIKKKGPVVVSMFSPTQTVASAAFSAVFLGRAVRAGSVVGMLLLFSGLYVVLWAKKKEAGAWSKQRQLDLEKQPLLTTSPSSTL